MVRKVVGHSVPAGVSCSFPASSVDAFTAREAQRFYDLSECIRDIVTASLMILVTLLPVAVFWLGGAW